MTEINEEKEVKKAAVKKPAVKKETAAKKPAVKKEATAKKPAKEKVVKDSAEVKSSVKKEATKKVKVATKEVIAAKKDIVCDEAYDLAYTMAQYLDEKKGKDIAIIKLLGKSIIADYFVVATASSTTAVKSLTEYLDEKLTKEHNIEPLRRDIDATWAAIDYGFVILHVQTEETRDYYKLEKLWSDGTNLERFTETN